jgi:hypothetical protein
LKGKLLAFPFLPENAREGRELIKRNSENGDRKDQPV